MGQVMTNGPGRAAFKGASSQDNLAAVFGRSSRRAGLYRRRVGTGKAIQVYENFPPLPYEYILFNSDWGPQYL